MASYIYLFCFVFQNNNRGGYNVGDRNAGASNSEQTQYQMVGTHLSLYLHLLFLVISLLPFFVTAECASMLLNKYHEERKIKNQCNNGKKEVIGKKEPGIALFSVTPCSKRAILSFVLLLSSYWEKSLPPHVPSAAYLKKRKNEKESKNASVKCNFC